MAESSGHEFESREAKIEWAKTQVEKHGRTPREPLTDDERKRMYSLIETNLETELSETEHKEMMDLVMKDGSYTHGYALDVLKYL